VQFLRGGIEQRAVEDDEADAQGTGEGPPPGLVYPRDGPASLPDQFPFNFKRWVERAGPIAHSYCAFPESGAGVSSAGATSWVTGTKVFTVDLVFFSRSFADFPVRSLRK